MKLRKFYVACYYFLMSSAVNNALSQFLKFAFIALPCLLSMYTLYWLEHGGIWALDTPHRGKTSVAILVFGLSLSFLIFSRLLKRT